MAAQLNLLAFAPAQTIAEFPANTFLESIVVDAENTIFITSHYKGKVVRIEPDGMPVIHVTQSVKLLPHFCWMFAFSSCKAQAG